jgi:hypothetical protein
MNYEKWFERYSQTFTKDQWSLRDAFEAGVASTSEISDMTPAEEKLFDMGHPADRRFAAAREKS